MFYGQFADERDNPVDKPNPHNRKWIFFTLMFFLTTTHWSMNGIPLFKVGSEINHFLLVDTEGCKIPKLDPFDSSIYLLSLIKLKKS
jgi:hypothetical protein